MMMTVVWGDAYGLVYSGSRPRDCFQTRCRVGADESAFKLNPQAGVDGTRATGGILCLVDRQMKSPFRYAAASVGDIAPLGD